MINRWLNFATYDNRQHYEKLKTRPYCQEVEYNMSTLFLQFTRVLMSRIVDSGSLADAMLQSKRSQERKLPIERSLLLKIG